MTVFKKKRGHVSSGVGGASKLHDKIHHLIFILHKKHQGVLKKRDRV